MNNRHPAIQIAEDETIHLYRDSDGRYFTTIKIDPFDPDSDEHEIIRRAVQKYHEADTSHTINFNATRRYENA